MRNEATKGPAIGMLGMNERWANRAIRWLAARGRSAFYSARERSLNAFEYPEGSEATYNLLKEAREATR